MKNLIQLVPLFSLILFLNSCEEPWQNLYNRQNLDGWETFIGTPLQGFDSLHAIATPEKVFSVVEMDGEKLIRISGEVNGSLATIDTLANYHLVMEFKWGDEVYTSRNSGLLYNSFGDFGAAFGTWMTNIECQMMHDNLGNTYLMNNTCCETNAVLNNEQYTYSKTGDLTQFGKDFNGAGINKAMDAENPIGEWNTVELYNVGRTTAHVINGKTLMVNTNTGTYEDGEIKPLEGGRIQIQSEGGELFIRSVRVQPIQEIPEEILQ